MSVTVIVPAYNAAPLLERCIESVVRHNGCDVDVVIVDDASTDATLAVAQLLAARWLNVTVLALAANSGQSAARNAGLLRATGKYVAFVDADDWCRPGRLDRLLTMAEQLGADMISDDCLIIEETSNRAWSTIYREYGVGGRFPRQVTLNEYLDTGWVLHPLIRADFLRQHGLEMDPEVRYGEDLLLYTKMLLLGARWSIMDEPLYCHAVRRGSITQSSMVPYALQRELSSLIEHMIDTRHPAGVIQRARALQHRVSYTVYKRELSNEIHRGNIGRVVRHAVRGFRYWRLVPLSVFSRLRRMSRRALSARHATLD